MSQKLPPIQYKLHPKMQQIMQQKRKRKQLLQNQKKKQLKQQQQIKKQRKQYFQTSKQIIQQKKQQIYSKKLIQHNKIKQEEKQRQIRIQIKKAQRLQKLLPHRKNVISELKEQYVSYLKQKDQLKQTKIKEIFQKRIEQANKQNQNIVSIEKRILEENLIDINQGVCILCLTSEAEIYMTQCKHLISCPQCQFILRMNKKCPVCRKVGNYKNLKDKNKKKSHSVSNKRKIQ